MKKLLAVLVTLNAFTANAEVEELIPPFTCVVSLYQMKPVVTESISHHDTSPYSITITPKKTSEGEAERTIVNLAISKFGQDCMGSTCVPLYNLQPTENASDAFVVAEFYGRSSNGSASYGNFEDPSNKSAALCYGEYKDGKFMPCVLTFKSRVNVDKFGFAGHAIMVCNIK